MWSVLSTVCLSIVFCFIFFGQFGYAQLAFDDDGCRTPDRGVGNCVPLAQCSPMMKVLRELKRPISQAVLKNLQAYTCGSNAAGIKVCCPSGPISLDPISNKPPISSSDEIPDITDHRNLYLLPTNCGYLDSNNKIVNGENANLNEFPWMALLQYKTRKGLLFKCGGSIINKNYILTAGHCITGLSDELASVRVGEHSIKNETDCENISKRERKCNPPVQDVTIEAIIPHPQFGTQTFLNDIGLLRVSTMNLNVENARPVCLPMGNEKSYRMVIVTGWGVTNAETGQTSDILQKVGLPVADKAACTRTYQNHNIRLGVKQICAGGVQNKDSCPGDSGGPMMVATIDANNKAKYIQEGIVSFGPKYCGITGYPGVYTLVKYYMDWILDTIKP